MPPAIHPNDRLSMETVARMLDVSEKTVRRLVADGTLPAERIGRRLIRIRRRDVDALGGPLRVAS